MARHRYAVPIARTDPFNRCVANDSLDQTFLALLQGVVAKFEHLRTMEPASKVKLISLRAGIYLLSEGDVHWYVGRANNLRSRVAQHRSKSAPLSECNLAHLIARSERLFEGLPRKIFVRMPEFKLNVQAAKKRVAAMSVRYIEEPECDRQLLLQLYALVVLKARYSDFHSPLAH
jgi:hypothetical protein